RGAGRRRSEARQAPTERRLGVWGVSPRRRSPVNPLLLLMGLLLLAYLGSFLVGEHSIRGVGLPSGTEYIVLGFILGPNLLRLLEPSMLETFDPIADVAVGWIALLIGFGFGVEEGKTARVGSILG